MNQNIGIKYIQKLVRASKLGSCLTIRQLPIVCLISLSLILNACSPDQIGGLLSGGGGTGDGGGGQGVQCGATKNPALKNKLFVRDIYEAIYQKNTKMKVIPNDVAGTSTVSPEAIRVLTNSLKAHYGPSSHNLEFTEDKFWVEFAKKMSFLDDEKTLLPSNDANSPINLPNGCSVVQVAYWDEATGLSEEGTLYVKEKFWKQLNQLNKIGLLAHEYFFKQSRKALYKNSNSVRNKVGELLSENGIPPLFKQWVPSLDKKTSEVLPRYKAGYKFCQGTSPDDPTAKLHFYQYTGADKKQHFTIPLLTSNSINSSFLNNTDISFDPEKNKSLATATDLLIYQTFLANNQQGLEPDASEALGDRRGNWYPRWFEDRGFIDSNLNNGSNLSLNSALYGLALFKEIIWSDVLMSSPRLIKVSLINPASDKLFGADLKLKSRDELTLTVQTIISSHLNKCFVPWPESDGWIAVLKKEISDNIAAGTHPKSFEKWNELIKKPILSGCESENDKLYTATLPSLLYSLTINNYDNFLVVPILSEKSFELPEWNSLNPGRIRVTQDTSTVNFDLQCEDYEMTYQKITKTADDAEPKLVANKKVTSAEDLRLENQEDKDKIRNENLDRLINFLQFKNPNAMSDSIQSLKGSGVDGNCQSYFEYMRVSCEHLGIFTAELPAEKEITVTNCPVEYTTWQPDLATKEAPEVCAIIKMNSTQHAYKVYFRFALDASSEEAPALTFVRFLGFEKPKDMWGDPIE